MTDDTDVDVARRVVGALHEAAPSPEFGTRILRRVEARRARQRAWRAGAAVAAAVAVIVTALVVTASPVEQDGSVATEPAPATLAWEDLPPAPVPARVDSSAVWTGEEVVLWGGRREAGSGSSRDGLRADGAAYNPATDSWRRIPDAPVGARLNVGFTWTGTELVVVGGVPAGPTGHEGLGAAYDPDRDIWRRLPDLPVSGMTDGWAAWTGREVLYLRPMGATVLGGQSQGPPRPHFFAYDPSAGTWREVAAPPSSLELRWDGAALAWAGAELIAVSQSSGKGSEDRRRAVAYDPATDAWRRVSTSKGRGNFIPHSHGLWNGHEVVTVGVFGADVSALHPRSGTWLTVPDGGYGLFGASAVATDAGDVYIFGERQVRLVRRPAPG